jgi:hypothetical protein
VPNPRKAREEEEEEGGEEEQSGQGDQWQADTPMGAASCSSSSAKHLFLLCLLLGFCFAFAASQQEQQQSDSCSSAGVAVAHLVPFNSSAFRCLTVWKQEDFVLRVCMLLNFAVLSILGVLLHTVPIFISVICLV